MKTLIDTIDLQRDLMVDRYNMLEDAIDEIDCNIQRAKFEGEQEIISDEIDCLEDLSDELWEAMEEDDQGDYCDARNGTCGGGEYWY